MTTPHREEALRALYLQLDELVTAEEAKTYGDFTHHLRDLIEDLEAGE